MSYIAPVVYGDIFVDRKQKSGKKPTPCEKCRFGWIPDGDVTRIVKDDGSVIVQYGKSVTCMDEGSKDIDILDDGIWCSRFELKTGEEVTT